MAAVALQSSPAFRLLVACVCWPRGAERDEGVRRAVAKLGSDWPALLAMVRRHRMAPLAPDGLTCAGIEPPAELKAMASRVLHTLGEDDLFAYPFLRLVNWAWRKLSFSRLAHP